MLLEPSHHRLALHGSERVDGAGADAGQQRGQDRAGAGPPARGRTRWAGITTIVGR